MNFACLNCKELLEIDEQYAGQEMRCPLCGAEVTVPEAVAGDHQSSNPESGPEQNLKGNADQETVMVVLSGRDDKSEGAGQSDGQNKTAASVDQSEPDQQTESSSEPDDMATITVGQPGANNKSADQSDDMATVTVGLSGGDGDGAGRYDNMDKGAAVASILTVQHGKKYKLGRPLAQGGMGAILDAKDVNIRRNVAMKVLLDPEQASKEMMFRFIEEAQITGQLEHPGIVPVYELGLDAGGNVFYTMKFVSGTTFKDILKDIKEGKKEAIVDYPLPHLLTIFQKICDAVAFAHSRRVIHRDLKPENVMIGGYGEVLVLDWGLAKVLSKEKKRTESSNAKPSKSPMPGKMSVDSVRINAGDSMLTMNGAVMGTPGFMAPEQAEGETEDINELADVYALGAILYNILTLDPPIGRGDLSDMLARTRRGEIPDPLTRKESKSRSLKHCPGGTIPESLSAVAMKALSLKATDRYATVKELQKDVDAYQSGFATSAERAGIWRLFKLFIGRHKVVSVAALVLMVVVAISSAVNYREQMKRRIDRRNSAPSLVENVKLLTERRKFDDAMTTIKSAIEYDNKLAEAHLVYAMLLLRDNLYKQAFNECRLYLQGKPEDENAKRLMELCRIGMERGPEAVPMGELSMVIERNGMLALAAEFTQSAERRLKLYRDKIETIWAGLGEQLSLTDERGLKFDASRKKQVTDLTPLTGMPLSEISLRSCPIVDIAPLEGMSLKRLDISDTKVANLTPLKGMPIVSLVLSASGRGCPVEDLTPLKGMTLTELNLGGTEVSDLKPLEGMALTTLDISGTQVRDLTPLKGMPLTSIVLSDGLGAACPVEDLRPLAGMQLTTLDLTGTMVSDLSPLQGMQLTSLYLSATSISDLSPLKGMPLTILDLRSCTGVSDLEPLKGMPLTRLNINGLKGVSDISPLRGMKLTWINLDFCESVTDLSPLENMPLTRLDISHCEGITDLTPLKSIPLTSLIIGPPGRIRKGIDVVRAMTGLTEINMTAAEEFWTSYDAGEFSER